MPRLYNHLERVLETTDNLSPLTLEMVQTALIGLKQKKSIQKNQQQIRNIANQKHKLKIKLVQQHQSQQQPRNSQRSFTDNNEKLATNQKQARNYFPSLDLISVKGQAPLLLPHPGGI